MKICAGAWLNCVVFIDRMMAISSACCCRYGSSSEISLPDWPRGRNSNGDPSSRGVPLHEREALAFGDDAGRNLLAVVLLQQRLVVEQVELRRRARHEQEDDVLGLRREVRPDLLRRAPAPSAEAAGEQPLVHQRGQRQRPDAEPDVLEEVTAGDVAEVGSWAIHQTAGLRAFAPSRLRDRRSACVADVLFRQRLVQVQQRVGHQRPRGLLGQLAARAHSPSSPWRPPRACAR